MDLQNVSIGLCVYIFAALSPTMKEIASMEKDYSPPGNGILFHTQGIVKRRISVPRDGACEIHAKILR